MLCTLKTTCTCTYMHIHVQTLMYMDQYMYRYMHIQVYPPELGADVPLALPAPAGRRCELFLAQFDLARDVTPLVTCHRRAAVRPVAENAYLVFVLKQTNNLRKKTSTIYLYVMTSTINSYVMALLQKGYAIMKRQNTKRYDVLSTKFTEPSAFYNRLIIACNFSHNQLIHAY